MRYNLFISHSWKYNDHYEDLLNLLNNSDLNFSDYSVPKNDPIHNAGNYFQLRQAIKNQISSASCVIILAGVYSTYSKWINIEIELAKLLRKKIIAIEPFASERTSQKVKDTADIIVGWNTQSIVNAIKSS